MTEAHRPETDEDRTGFCPCGSQSPFNLCCGPLLNGERKASSAEQLMRSRYTAYVRGNRQYLEHTWHPSTRPPDLQPESTFQPQWLELSVLGASGGEPHDKKGVVEFIARYTLDGRIASLYEKSRFVQENGCWYYLDGSTTSRNAACPCGSGRKFKRCCGKQE